VAVTLLLVALMYAAVAHGAFHAGELVVVVVVVAAALGVAFVAVRPGRDDLGPATLAAAALAAWYVIAGAAAGHPAGAGPAVGLLFTGAATIVIVRRADVAERDLLLTGVLVIGALIALSAWIGVAFHHGPWAIEDNGLWRGSSTITYANATGGLVGALALVALDRVIEGGSRRAFSLLAATCVLGLLATASRGALLGFAVGLVVLAGLRRRSRVASIIPAVAGGVVAFAALLPSMPSGHQAHPAVAFVGLFLGATIAIAPTRVAIAAALVCVALGSTSGGIRHDVRAAWSPISTQRLTTGSSDRSHERRAAVELARDHPVAGVGPGNVTLHWSVFYFVPVDFSVHYAHNEYLQVLVESGVVGLAIAVIGAGWVLAATRRTARGSPGRLAPAGIAAALVMLAIHSATDFLWHIPLVPVVACALLGVLTTVSTQLGESRHDGADRAH
jgi:O-antigen ligase